MTDRGRLEERLEEVKWDKLEEFERRVVVVERPKLRIAGSTDRTLNVLEELAVAQWAGRPGPKLEVILDDGDTWDFTPTEYELADQILADLGVNRWSEDENWSNPLDHVVGRLAFEVGDDFEDPVALDRFLGQGWEALPGRLPFHLGSATWSQWVFPETQDYALAKVPGYDLLTVVASGCQGRPGVLALEKFEPGQHILDGIREQILSLWGNVPGTCDDDGGPPSSVSGSWLLTTEVMERWIEEQWGDDEEEED